MFKMIENLTKAAVAIAVTPIAVAVDIVMIPFDAENKGEVFTRTGDLLDSAGKNVSDAVKGK